MNHALRRSRGNRIVGGVCGGLGDFFGLSPWLFRLVFLWLLLPGGLPGLLPGIFQGLDRMQYVAIASVIRWTVFAAGVFAFVRSPQQVWIVPLVEGGAIGVLVVYYLATFRRCFGSLRQPIDRASALSMYRQALPIGASELVWAVKFYFATIWLAILVGGPGVGWFGAAHRVMVSLHTFVWLYFFNLLPSLSRGQLYSISLHSYTTSDPDLLQQIYSLIPG